VCLFEGVSVCVCVYMAACVCDRVKGRVDVGSRACVRVDACALVCVSCCKVWGVCPAAKFRTHVTLGPFGPQGCPLRLDMKKCVTLVLGFI